MAPTLILALRNGEKPADAEDPGRPLGDAGPGLDEHGEVNSSSLTIRGWQRAGALAGSRLCRSLPPGGDEVSVLVPQYEHPRNHRAYQTVDAVAQNLGSEPESICDAGDVDGLFASVMAHRGTVVVCWEHDALARFCRHLAPVVPEKWPEGRFDVVWRFTPAAEIGAFAWEQVSQRLLPGDL